MPSASLHIKNKAMYPLASKENVLDVTDVTESTCHDDDDDGPMQKVSSIHQLVNQERTKQNLKPLKRSRPLDFMAQKVVCRIAEQDDGSKGQIPMPALQKYLNSGWVGQNVGTGQTVADMHQEAMETGTNSCDMILHKHFKAFGIATATNAKTGTMYMVHIFRGKKNT